MFGFPNFLKKPELKKGLARARDEGLITEREFLELKIERAKAELANRNIIRIEKEKMIIFYLTIFALGYISGVLTERSLTKTKLKKNNLNKVWDLLEDPNKS